MFRIQQTKIARRITDRLKLYPGIGSAILAMTPTVQPVSDINELLTDSKISQATKDLTATAGTYVEYFLVPAGKRWKFDRYEKISTTASSQMRIYDREGVYMAIKASGTAAEYDAVTLTMDEGWSLGLLTTGNGADSAIIFRVLYREEDAF